MAGEWRTYFLEQLAGDSPNAMSTGPFGSAISSKYFDSEGVPVIRGGNLSVDTGLKMSDEGLVFVSHQKAEEFNRSVVRPGDLIFTCWGTINQVGLITDKLKYSEYIISNKQMKFTPDQNRVDPRFLYYLFSGPVKQAEILQNAIGAAVPGFNLGQLKQHQVTIPDLDEQKQISGYLGMLDDKIELNRQMNATLEAMAQALFKSWFVDFDPVIDNALAAGNLIPEPLQVRAEARKALGDQRKTLPDTIQKQFPNGFVFSENIGWVPEGWDVFPLAKIAHYQNGLAMQKFRPENEDDYLPVVKIAQLKSGRVNGEEKASPDIKPECIIDDGDIVFSWSGSLMVDVWCGGKAALNQHLFKVTSNSHPKWFFYHYTNHHLHEFQRIAADKAVTMGHIKREHLNQAFCSVPDLDLLESASKMFDSLLERGIANRIENRQLEQTRDTLLPKLLSGQLRIPDAEKQVDKVI